MAQPLAPQRTSHYLIIFFLLFAVPLFALHLRLLWLPFFWDEQGQFVPTALDILRHGWWIARSTLPNVHPPGVEAVLALTYKLFGYSIPITRAAMLLWASFGLLFTFLLSIELTAGLGGAPAFLPPLLLLISPLFFTQSFMAQLDMPCMVLQLLALLLFIKKRFALCAVACVALVLVKETGIVAPLIFFLFCLRRKQFKNAGMFVSPAVALSVWLLFLHRGTGYWTGDPGFAHYNVGYALQPVRIVFCLLRRIYYLFFAEMRFVGSAAIVFAVWRLGSKSFKTEAWRVTLAVSVATLILVTVLGGAELERYLMPVLPVFYIAAAVAFVQLRRPFALGGMIALAAGLLYCIYWNPPYPFPYENNFAMVDFVDLQRAAGSYADDHLQGKTIATAWPYSASLRNPDFGFVAQPKQVIETNDFHPESIKAAGPNRFDALITYTRTWDPTSGVISNKLVRHFLERYYDWEPDITQDECAELGLVPAVSWNMRGQEITVYVRR